MKNSILNTVYVDITTTYTVYVDITTAYTRLFLADIHIYFYIRFKNIKN